MEASRQDIFLKQRIEDALSVFLCGDTLAVTEYLLRSIAADEAKNTKGGQAIAYRKRTS